MTTWHREDSQMTDWHKIKCACGHPACNQYKINIQGNVGFTEEEANMIVAAPEMLKLLELIQGSFGGGRIITFQDDVIEEINAVIAKIKGEQ